MEFDQNLADLEARLKSEAAGYLRRSDERVEADDWPEREFMRLTGCRLEDIGINEALERITRMLAAQARWSRRRHYRYDLNRHILLRKLHRTLAGQYTATGNKKPAAARWAQSAGL